MKDLFKRSVGTRERFVARLSHRTVLQGLIVRSSPSRLRRHAADGTPHLQLASPKGSQRFMMALRLPRLQAPVCQVCEFAAARRLSSHSAQHRQFGCRSVAATIALSTKRGHYHTSSINQRIQSPSMNPRAPHTTPKNVGRLSSPWASSSSDVEEDMQDVRIALRNLESSSQIPSDKEILTALTYCEVVTDSLVGPQRNGEGHTNGSISKLLTIDDTLPTKGASRAPQISPQVQKYVDELARIAYQIVEMPTVFITPDVLKQYVDIQAKLRKPALIPSVLQMYATKWQPIEGSSPVEYAPPNSNKAKNAIPPSVADRALTAAIDTKNLDAATAIVANSYAKRAFHRNKILRKSALPVTAIVAAPLAAYALASKLSIYETAADPQMATNVTFFGILAYMGFTSSIGLVALTTANDHMDRVTWAIGTPLTQRWLREDERAALDRIAGAWGFRESWRKGEEEGSEWETLREWIGMRGMVLDQTSLMPGME